MKKTTTLFLLAILSTTLTIAQTAGTIDPTFNVLDDGSNFSLLDSDPYAMAVQSDDKIVVGGYFDDVNGVAINRLVRLATDGSVDNTFDAGTGPSGPVFDIKIQTNGKVLVGGNFSMFDGNAYPDIVRLNSDGSIDNTFSSGTGTDSPVETIAIQADGKILIGGDFTSYNGNTANGIARLNADGTFDNTFDAGDGADDIVRVIAVQSDGKVLVGGDFNTFGTQARTKLARLNSDGTVDLTYDVTILGSSVRVESLVLESDGDLIIGGSFSSVEGSTRTNIARVDDGGNLDSGFATLLDNSVNSMALMTSGKIIIAGSFTLVNGIANLRVAKLNADGTSDLTFTSLEGPDNIVRDVALNSSEEVFISGSFTTIGTTPRNRIAKLMSNGLDDATFASTTGANGTVYTSAVQPDGKIIVGGYFTSMNGVSRRRIARLNADGTLDTSFDPGTGFDGNVWSVQLQPDGKIIVGGFFTSFDGTPQNRITRLNADGSRDNTFNVAGDGADAVVIRVQLQPDGKILAGGFFTSFNNETHNRIVRLNADGTIDGTFDAGTGVDQNVWDVRLQSDGKILIAGFFNSVDGTTRNYIARLNTDGSLDNTFDPGTGPDGNIYKMAVQPDGKVIIGGLFQNVNGISQNRLARLNTDGTQDMSFDIGTGFNDPRTTRSLTLPYTLI